MGTAEEKAANDLLAKCNIDLRVNNLSDCGAKMFVHLYESILGEKVPDFIAMPCCQEDDAHNVQAVIDSLALDYLQVSLSHITGENIVKGDKESIKNLLEIFDGLLEYLTEELSETASHNGGGPNQMATGEVQGTSLEDKQATVSSLKPPSAMGSPQSSEIVAPLWEVDGSESTSELIKLGDTAYLFSLRHEELPAEGEISKTIAEPKERAPSKEPSSILFCGRSVLVAEGAAKFTALPRDELSSSAKKLGEPIRPAIPLQPPYQPSISRPFHLNEKSNGGSGRYSPPFKDMPSKPQKLASSDLADCVEQKSQTLSGGILSLSRITYDLPNAEDEPESEADELVPDVGLDDIEKETDENVQYKPVPSSEEDRLPRYKSTQSTRPKQRNLLNRKSQLETSIADSLAEESLSRRRMREQLSKLELHNMSEKLSRRLNELDAMLKHALGERSREELSVEEDHLSQHSDSVMDYRQMKPELAASHPRRPPSRRRSLSASPPPPTRQRSYEVGRALGKDVQGPAGIMRDHLQREEEQRKLRAKLLTRAYDDELRAYEACERVELTKLRAKAKEMEQKYKENLFKQPPREPRPAKIDSRKHVPRNRKPSQWIPSRGFAKPKKAAPMKVKENDLLPLLLEDFPHLHISHPTMNKMWQKQLAQIEQLKSPSKRSQLKLQSEVVEALKKHDLLVEIIKKEQAHNRRLQEFRQRIIQQKCTQNKMRDRRQQVVRAKKYYQDYRVQLRAKMMRARTREERIFKNLFEEGLEIQKQRLHELKVYTKDKRAEQRRQHQIELESMENYYKDQFSMLAETVSEERQEIQAREQAHTRMLSKVKRELKSKMEKEIKELQDMITRDDDDSFFRELEADHLKARLQMASFQYSKNYHFL